MKATALLLVASALLSVTGCVHVSPASRPADWPASVPVSTDRIGGRFTGSSQHLAKSAGVWFSNTEIYGANLRRKVTGFTFALQGDTLRVRAEINDGTAFERVVPVVIEDGALVWERRYHGREGVSAASYRDVWRISPDASGGLIFEHRSTSVGLLGIVPGGYYGRDWWRLERVVY